MDSYDCIVLGEDGAATSCAALLAGTGLQTLLLMRSQAQGLPCDLLLPCCHSVLERLKLVDSLAAGLTPPGQALQVVDAQGNVPLAIDGQSAGDVRFWQPTAGLLHQLLIQAAEQNGARVLPFHSAVEVHRLRPDRWRVKASDFGSEFRSATAAFVVDTRGESIPGRTWTEICGVYQNAAPVTARAAAVASRSLDSAGWCSLTPLADGLTSVRVLCDVPVMPSSESSLAELWEDRLVQSPVLLEHLAAAELTSDLRGMPCTGLYDPWGAFRDSCDLLHGEYLASRVVELFRIGRSDAIAAPLGQPDAAEIVAKTRSALAMLFGQDARPSSSFASHFHAVQLLNRLLGDCGSVHSPFPSTGDKAILTRA